MALEDRKREFPDRPSPTWATNLGEALKASERVTLSDEAIDYIKWLVVDPQRYIKRSKGSYQLEPNALRVERLPNGRQLYVLRLEIFGCVTAVSPHNERLVDVWPTPYQRAGTDVPRLPRRSQLSDSGGRPLSEFRVDVDDIGMLRKLLRHTEAALEKEERRRPYSLSESLANEGQREAGTSVFTRYVTAKDEVILTLTAVKGNNRAYQRLGLHGLNDEDLVLGVDARKLEIAGDGVVRTAPKWIQAHLDVLERKLNSEDDEEFELAAKADLVSIVEEDVVVGSDPVDRLAALVRADNVPEHILSVLSFDDAARYDALGRQLLARYEAEGVITAAEHEVLAGDAVPDAESEPELYGLAEAWDPDSAGRLTELRDWRNRTLTELLFPVDDANRKVVREVLAEPAKSHLAAPHVQQRSRLLASLQMKGYGRTWNPRAGEIFNVRDAKQGVAVTHRRLVELLAEATAGRLEPELRVRMHPFLAARELVVPDRGSLDTVRRDAQGREEPTQRRQPSNVIDSIASAQRGLPFLKEVLAADIEARHVRPVDPQGNPVTGRRADRDWINSADGFPKLVRQGPDPDPEPEPDPEPLDDVAAWNAEIANVLAEAGALLDQVASLGDRIFALGTIADRDTTLRVDEATHTEITQTVGLRLDNALRPAIAELNRITDAT